MRAWRLVKTRYAATAFDGEGARVNGGRWNSKGNRVAYASESVALATLEVLVHLQSTAALTSYSLVSLRFPDDLIDDLDASELPPNWRQFPAPPEVQRIGDRWVSEMRSAVLRVPSVVITSSHNFLLNPSHRDFRRVKVDPAVPFEFDPRLLGQ